MMLSWDACLAGTVVEWFCSKRLDAECLTGVLLSICELNFFGVLHYSQVIVNFRGDSKNPH